MVSAAEVTYSSGCKDTAVSTNSSIFNRFNRRPVKVPVGENLGENGHLRPGFADAFAFQAVKAQNKKVAGSFESATSGGDGGIQTHVPD